MSDSSDAEFIKELRGYENDKRMTERAVEFENNRWANILRNGMGEDIRNVTSGKVKVKLSLKEKIGYKWRNFKEKFKKKEEKLDGYFGQQ